MHSRVEEVGGRVYVVPEAVQTGRDSGSGRHDTRPSSVSVTYIYTTTSMPNTNKEVAGPKPS